MEWNCTGLLDNSGGPITGFIEGGNSGMVKEEPRQELDQISEQNFFIVERQVERVWKDLVG